MTTDHAAMLADVLTHAVEALEAVQQRATDTDLRASAETALPQLQAARDVLRDHAHVVLTRDGMRTLGVGLEATLAAMRRQFPELAVLPDLHGYEDVH